MCPDTILCIANIAGDVSPASTAEVKSSSGSSSSISGSIILPREPLSQEQPGPEASLFTPVSVVDDEVIQINGTSRMDVVPDWYSAPRSHTEQASLPPSPTLALRLLPSDVTISFYEGYDYERTRSYIKSTVKATRKKLEKIKQLLAEGQMPEQTLEEVADPLLQSVFLPSKPRKSTLNAQSDSVINTLAEENDAMTRIVAFDDELNQGDDISDEALFNWENIPDRPPAPRRGSSSSARTPIPRIDGSPNRLRRPRTSAIDVQLAEVSVSYKSYPVAVPLASRLLVNLGDLAVIDNMKTSTWNKFLTELRPRDGGITRPTGAPMVRVMLKMLRAGESSDSTEADLAVKVAPLRLHIDQDALDFFKAFFAFKLEPPAVLSDSPPTLSPANKAERTNSSKGFVQRVEIAAIKIKLDYKPKRVDYLALRQGKTIEMMNFFHFEASEMVLRHLVLSGVPSWAKVGDMLQEIWTPDVKANQLADFLAGINPVRSVVNVGHGVADLVLLPVAQYRKDGRLARGLQRGGTKFAKSTAMEAIKLGARLATGTQVILEHAEHVLGGRIDGLPTNTSSGARSSTPTADQQARSEWLLTATESSDEEDESQMSAEPVSSKFSQQPEDVRVGLQTAYRSLSGNVRSAAETILAVPMEVYERSSEVRPFSCLDKAITADTFDQGPVRAVVRAVPIAVLKPMIGASEAVSKTLLGLRNTLDPGAKEEIQE